MNDNDLWIPDPAEIAEVERFRSDPEFPQHNDMQQWRLIFAPTQPFWGATREGDVETEGEEAPDTSQTYL
jgi:hypothetical protein